MDRARALKASHCEPTDRLPHWESLANPDFEQLMTGIDPWEHPQLARRKLHEMLPLDVGAVPASDEPIPRLPDGELTFADEDGHQRARWGTGKTWHWDWGHRFKSIDDMVKDMVALGRSHPGYFMSIGNLLPWNLPADAIKTYFEAAERHSR